jgi:hypothetical protein
MNDSISQQIRDAAEKPYSTMIAQHISGIATYTAEQFTAAARIEYGIPEPDEIALDIDGDIEFARDQQNAEAIKTAERHYAEHDKLYNEVAKPILDARREALAAIVELTGVGHTFQDADGIVYHIADKNGTFVEFTPFEIKRTQRVYAEGGSHIFARKTAEALGFENIFKPMKPEDAAALANLSAGVAAGAKGE